MFHSIWQEFQLPKRRLRYIINRTQKNNNKQPTDCRFLKWRVLHSLFGHFFCLLWPTFWNIVDITRYRIHSFTRDCHPTAYKTIQRQKFEFIPTVLEGRVAVWSWRRGTNHKARSLIGQYLSRGTLRNGTNRPTLNSFILPCWHALNVVWCYLEDAEYS